MITVKDIQIKGYQYTGCIYGEDLTAEQRIELQVSPEDSVEITGEYTLRYDWGSPSVVVENVVASNGDLFIDLYWPNVNVDHIESSIEALDDGTWEADRLASVADHYYEGER